LIDYGKRPGVVDGWGCGFGCEQQRAGTCQRCECKRLFGLGNHWRSSTRKCRVGTYPFEDFWGWVRACPENIHSLERNGVEDYAPSMPDAPMAAGSGRERSTTIR